MSSWEEAMPKMFVVVAEGTAVSGCEMTVFVLLSTVSILAKGRRRSKKEWVVRFLLVCLFFVTHPKRWLGPRIVMSEPWSSSPSGPLTLVTKSETVIQIQQGTFRKWHPR